uniref:non-specific serine/threonine protein kinase n=1 Tax=Meloidogyne javanica TaxID=6303 RepID=A0A915MB02_MELJA
MKSRIRKGEYNFAGTEWTLVSEAAKDLIRRCLITDPEQRVTIEELLNHKWLLHYTKSPTTPLTTTEVMSDRGQAEEMEQALASMRVDDVHIKHINDAQNSLLDKRRRKAAAGGGVDQIAEAD